MVISEDVNSRDGSGDAEQHYLRVASMLQDRLQSARASMGDGASALTEILEIAAQEFGIEGGDECKSMKRRKKSEGSKSVECRCQHSCHDHKEVMCPKLWENLPRELLRLVFAHLPVDKISLLRFLNKDWQKTITADSDFLRMCSEAYPKLLCLITRNRHNMFWARVLDLNSSTWYAYEIVAGRPAVDWTAIPWPTMTYECEDGGLVCFITYLNLDSKKKKARTSFFFNVVNPLTRTSRELPPLFDLKTKLVQMQVNRRSNSFKVFVLGDRFVWTNASTGWRMDGVAAQVYDSLTEEWTKPDYFSDFALVNYRKGTAYDFANGRLFTMEALRTDLGERISSASYKDRRFVLLMGSDGPANEESLANELPTYYIEEFRWESVWVKVKTHRCNPFEHPPKTDYDMSLYACNGYLMVFSQLSESNAWERYAKGLAWLYDLSTSKWSVLDLPLLPLGRRTYDPQDPYMFIVEVPGHRKLKTNGDYTYHVSLMCKPDWAV